MSANGLVETPAVVRWCPRCLGFTPSWVDDYGSRERCGRCERPAQAGSRGRIISLETGRAWNSRQGVS